jgi:hypothetical protein
VLEECAHNGKPFTRFAVGVVELVHRAKASV